jgi:hypothetical protein
MPNPDTTTAHRRVVLAIDAANGLLRTGRGRYLHLQGLLASDCTATRRRGLFIGRPAIVLHRGQSARHGFFWLEQLGLAFEQWRAGRLTLPGDPPSGNA